MMNYLFIFKVTIKYLLIYLEQQMVLLKAQVTSPDLLLVQTKYTPNLFYTYLFIFMDV